jgi:pimeloyl-ACP methyl ester carboxylesterase
MRTPFKALAVVVLLLAVVAIAGVGEVLSAPARRSIGQPPADLGAEPVELMTASGDRVFGWLALGAPGKGAVLLLHGVRADRRVMLRRARALKGGGYSVLLIDLPAHGESSGDRITFGWREAGAVRAALDLLRAKRANDRIGVIGVSLGAASLALSGEQPDAVVLESMYPTIREAVQDRMALRLGPVGSIATPMLLWQLPMRLDISENQLRPIEGVKSLHVPVLIASGTADRHTTAAETRRIYAEANAPKELWLVEGAGHVDLYDFAPAEYERRVFSFLARNLRRS